MSRGRGQTFRPSFETSLSQYMGLFANITVLHFILVAKLTQRDVRDCRIRQIITSNPKWRQCPDTLYSGRHLLTERNKIRLLHPVFSGGWCRNDNISFGEGISRKRAHGLVTDVLSRQPVSRSGLPIRCGRSECRPNAEQRPGSRPMVTGDASGYRALDALLRQHRKRHTERTRDCLRE